jgi:hypothetical protein
MMKNTSKFFSFFIFWGENIVFIGFFLLFEIFILPLVYFMTYYNIIYSTLGLFTTIFNVIKWLLFGFLYLTYLVLFDVWVLIFILGLNRGCREVNPNLEKDNSDANKLNLDA